MTSSAERMRRKRQRDAEAGFVTVTVTVPKGATEPVHEIARRQRDGESAVDILRDLARRNDLPDAWHEAYEPPAAPSPVTPPEPQTPPSQVTPRPTPPPMSAPITSKPPSPLVQTKPRRRMTAEMAAARLLARQRKRP